MGNAVAFIKQYLFDRRKHITNESHSRTDHPELTSLQPEKELPTCCSEFYLACRINDIDKVRELLPIMTLEDIDRVELNGSTALHSACYHGHEQIVQLLLQAGTDRSIPNKYNYLPFDEARNDRIRELFFRHPTTNRLVSNTENYVNKNLANLDRIDDIKRFFRKATEEQNPIWIIKAYTAETDFYKAINTEMAGGAAQGQLERKYIIALLCHHPQLDRFTFVGTSYRVIKMNSHDEKQYQLDTLLMTNTFLSTSIDEKAIAAFVCHQDAPLTERQLVKADTTAIKSWVTYKYQIKNPRTALHIEEISQYTNEGEVLIMPFTVFKVIKIDKIKPEYLMNDQFITFIELEECDN